MFCFLEMLHGSALPVCHEVTGSVLSLSLFWPISFFFIFPFLLYLQLLHSFFDIYLHNRTVILHTYATRSELPSNISTLHRSVHYYCHETWQDVFSFLFFSLPTGQVIFYIFYPDMVLSFHNSYFRWVIRNRCALVELNLSNFICLMHLF